MRRLYILILALTIPFGSCTKFLEVDPPSTKVDLKTAFASDAAAISLMTGIYSRAADPSAYSFPSLSVNAGLSADELTSYGFNSSFDAFYVNALNAASFTSYWGELYSYIYTANLMIEGLAAPNGVSAPVKKQLEGEAKFTRAYFYFYLVNLFGDVPLVTSTTYTNNTLLSRTPSPQVYAFIIQDLKDAQLLLSANYLNADLKSVTTNRIRPNKWAATALLAKAYLFNGDHQNAITESSSLINEKTVYQLETLESTFTINSKETIFAFEPSSTYQNTYEGAIFILNRAPDYSHSVGMSSWLYNAFEPGDRRKSSWVGTYIDANGTYHYAYKYKVGSNQSGGQVAVTENQVILRLGEQYLIRAEAYIQTGQVPLGIADLNEIRIRARADASAQVPNPLPSLSTSIQKPAALQAVEQEHKVEMFTEMGDRWLTLKRMKGFNNTAISRADEVMPTVTTAKGGSWDTDWQLYPIPQEELRKDKNIKQNHGY